MNQSGSVEVGFSTPDSGPLAPGQQPPIPQPAPQPARPAWLPEKFKTPEDFAASYHELETRLGQPKAPAATPAPSGSEAAPGTGGLLSQAELDHFAQEYQTSGALSEASYTALAKKGITKDLVDAFVAGQAARGEQYANVAIQTAGGQEQYEAMAAWAGANLSDGELKQYNAEINSGNPARVQWAVRGLAAMYREAGNAQNAGGSHRDGDPRFRTNRIQPQSQGSGGFNQVASFQSREQVVAAMRDPRYRTDPAYRAAVEAALTGSNELFNIKIS